MSGDLAHFLLDRIAEDEDMARLMVQMMGGNVDRLSGISSPGRVLAECEARRRIVELHKPLRGLEPPDFICETCGSGEPYEYPTEWPCETLRLIAAPFSDHPDYDPSWRA